MLVLENQRNEDVLGFQTLLDEPGLDPCPSVHLVGWRRGGTGDSDRPIFDQASRSATTYIEAPSDELVEALAGLF